MGGSPNYTTKNGSPTMSLIIFFGMALGVFTLGCVVIGVTLYHWNKQRKTEGIQK